jgi:oxygen-independent coproporphyrinogen-3 oxidase
MCRDQGINHINIDMMYGLPHQTLSTMRDAAEKALSLEPDRIALFGYAHVPWLKKHMRLLPEDKLPSSEARLDMFEEAASIFEDAGYIPIGIDHFAKEDDNLTDALRNNRLNRSFQGYTDDNAPYLLSMGASAISRIGNTYIQNEAHLPQYREKISKGLMPVSKYYQSTSEDELRGRIIKSLMCNLSANPFKEAQSFRMDHHDFNGCYEGLHDLVHDDLVKITDDGTVHILVRQAARLAAACFDQKLSPSTAKHASST